MCSVVGYVGTQKSRAAVLDGLKRLEYRGYDSSGYACLDGTNHRLMYAKAEGALKNLIRIFDKNPIDGRVGIGHTRWSTHGVANEQNAHPHFDCHKTISIVHNGIIENYTVLKKELIAQGHVFHSDTDTEVIAHLMESEFQNNVGITLPQLMTLVVGRLVGAYAFMVVMQEYPDTIIAVRKGSPLCIGVGDQEMFVASDVLAFAGKIDRVVFMPEKTFAIVTKDDMQLYDFAAVRQDFVIKQLDAQWIAVEKNGHEHFMLKEIYEQKNVIERSVRFFRTLQESLWTSIGLSKEEILSLKKVVIVACGTSWHAGRIAEFYFDEIVGIPATAVLASEFRYRTFFPQDNVLYIAVSQSGETADTLEAIRFLKEHNQRTLALTNVASSSLVRECDGFLLTQAGPEIAVASTKAFTAQLTALYWFANRIAYERSIITQAQLLIAEEDLLVAAVVLENMIDQFKHEIVHTLAPYYAKFDRSIFLGRHITYPLAMEAALKLKEIGYIFSQVYPAGELKHGPLALVDDKTPVFLFSHPDPIIYQKMLSSAQEVKARKGRLLAVAFEGQKELIDLADDVFVFPAVSPHLSVIATIGVIQIFVYYIALARGCNIDKPRNLAKSVTVE
jgi:glucosamine--fructose-6-phosphate aminotransferase (isomerizing)